MAAAKKKEKDDDRNCDKENGAGRKDGDGRDSANGAAGRDDGKKVMANKKKAATKMGEKDDDKDCDKENGADSKPDKKYIIAAHVHKLTVDGIVSAIKIIILY